MTDEPFDFGVLHERDRAPEALHRTPAIAAHDKRRHSAPIEIQDGLLLVFQRPSHHLDQASRQGLAISLGGLIAHIDELDLGVIPAHPPRQLGHLYLVIRGLVIGGHAGSGRAHDQTRASDGSELPRHPAGLVARRAVLLVGGRAFLVEADEPEPGNRGEDRRAAAQHDLRLAAPGPPPLLRALELGQLRLEHGDRCVQPATHPLDELRGE